MTQFFIALAVFLASHVIPAYKPLRQRIVDAVGERAFLAGYGVLSLGLMIWLFAAYFNAPYVELWPPVNWARWIPVLAMPVACVLVVTGLTTPNPFSLSFNRAQFDPAHPGVVRYLRHPALWGMILWSGSHIPPNGDLAAVIMFGLLTALGLYGPLSLDAKRRTRMGDHAWTELNNQVQFQPIPGLAGVGVAKILGGLALYAILLLAHEIAIGLSPLPV